MLVKLIKLFIALSLAVPPALGVSGYALAATAPFVPGDALFPIQNFAEQARVQITWDGTTRTALLLDLAERRMRDLQTRSGSDYELEALIALDAATNDAFTALSKISADHSAPLQSRMATLSVNTLNVMSRLKILPKTNPDLLAKAQNKMRQIGLAALGQGKPPSLAPIAGGSPSSPKGSTPTPTPNTSVDPRAVPFIGADASMHSFFPLNGKHAALDCSSCHSTGTYKGTTKQCESCHSNVKPASHYKGDCTSCHNATDWKQVKFDHALVGATTNCESCHSNKKPTNHFAGACANCHKDATNWKNVKFDHSLAGADELRVVSRQSQTGESLHGRVCFVPS